MNHQALDYACGAEALCRVAEEEHASPCSSAEDGAGGHASDLAYLATLAERIHSQPMQLLSAARLCLHQLKRPIEGRSKAEVLEQADRLLEQSLVELRKLMHDAHPPGLFSRTFTASVNETALELKSAFGIECELDLTGLEAQAPPGVVDLVVRVLREAAINAHKHANATRVKVEIVADPSGFRLTVSNKPLSEPLDRLIDLQGGFGLFMLRRWAEAMGGHLKLRVSNRLLADTECDLFLPSPSVNAPSHEGGGL